MESMFSSNRLASGVTDEKVGVSARTSNMYTTSRLRGTHPSASEGRQRAWRSRPPASRSFCSWASHRSAASRRYSSNGTNLLVADEGLDTLVIQTGEGLNRIALDGGIITADAGVSLARLGVFAWQHSLTGLEFAHGIPGSLGGGVVMNAGAYGGELKDVLSEVTALFPDGVRTLRGEELALGYRRSFFTDHPEAVVLRAKLALHGGDQEAIKARMEELSAKRRASQPIEMPSAGSTFKRPEGYFAGTLIEQCGLKGKHVGGAEVSRKHAGFVVNAGGATCADVLALIKKVQDTVFTATGVTLEPEVKIIR